MQIPLQELRQMLDLAQSSSLQTKAFQLWDKDEIVSRTPQPSHGISVFCLIRIDNRSCPACV
jgi:hypothetical protein